MFLFVCLMYVVPHISLVSIFYVICKVCFTDGCPTHISLTVYVSTKDIVCRITIIYHSFKSQNHKSFILYNFTKDFISSFWYALLKSSGKRDTNFIQFICIFFIWVSKSLLSLLILTI